MRQMTVFDRILLYTATPIIDLPENKTNIIKIAVLIRRYEGFELILTFLCSPDGLSSEESVL